MQATENKLNKAFEIPTGELEERVGVILDAASQYSCVVPLRNLAFVESVRLLNESELARIVRAIPIRSTPIRPYADAQVKLFNVGPGALSIGQTFISEPKVLSMLRMETAFHSYLPAGVCQMGPFVAYGQECGGQKSLGLYLPPIVEQHKDAAVLLDGIHRNFLCKVSGAMSTTVRITGSGCRLPFEPLSWDDARMVKEKPAIEERYKSLRPEYYRDLAFVGFDG